MGKAIVGRWPKLPQRIMGKAVVGRWPKLPQRIMGKAIVGRWPGGAFFSSTRKWALEKATNLVDLERILLLLHQIYWVLQAILLLLAIQACARPKKATNLSGLERILLLLHQIYWVLQAILLPSARN